MANKKNYIEVPQILESTKEREREESSNCLKQSLEDWIKFGQERRRI